MTSKCRLLAFTLALLWAMCGAASALTFDYSWADPADGNVIGSAGQTVDWSIHIKNESGYTLCFYSGGVNSTDPNPFPGAGFSFTDHFILGPLVTGDYNKFMSFEIPVTALPGDILTGVFSFTAAACVTNPANGELLLDSTGSPIFMLNTDYNPITYTTESYSLVVSVPPAAPTQTDNVPEAGTLTMLLGSCGGAGALGLLRRYKMG